MHLFSIKERHGWRGFAHFELPENPICWLLGHKAKVEVVEPKYIEPYRVVRCRVCDRQYQRPYDRETRLSGHDAQQWQAQLVEVARRNPKGVEESCSGRIGYGVRQLELGAELYAYPPSRNRLRENWGFRLHIGGRGSETPFDASVQLGLIAGYFKLGGIGGRYAEWLGRGHKRDIALSIHGSSLWWKLWFDNDMGNDDGAHRCDAWRPVWWSSERKARQWMCLRDGHVSLDWRDYVYGGRSTVDREVLVEVDAFWRPSEPLADDDGPYLIHWKLEAWDRHRKRGPHEFTYSADWSCKEGIPEQNHSWKGDCVYSSAVRLPGEESIDTWLEIAGAGLDEQVRSWRKRSGFRWRSRAEHQGVGT